MLKKLQALKAKKGFTLVELIVVIAIIGVLAAILVPTMLGYVTSSRVTSANSTAASIKNNVDSFLTACDTNGYGMKQSDEKKAELVIQVTKDGWSCGAAANAEDNFKGEKWGTAATNINSSATKSTLTSAEELLCFELCQLFPEVKQANILVSMVGGKCVAVAYTADQSEDMTAGTDYPTLEEGKFPAAFKWDDKTAGVSENGIIVGTAPAVPLGASSTTP